MNSFVLISLMALSVVLLPCKVTGETTDIKSIRIVGAVWCKSCKIIPKSPLDGETVTNIGPITKNAFALPADAKVSVRCYTYEDSMKFDEEKAVGGVDCGAFSLEWKSLSSFNPSKCFAVLGKSEFAACPVPLYPGPDSQGAPLNLISVSDGVGLYTAGILSYGIDENTCPPKL